MSAPLTRRDMYMYQLHARITFLELVNQALLKQVAALSSPAPEQWLRDWATKVRASSDGLTFPGTDPSLSDLMAQEFQEQANRFLKHLLGE